MYCDGGWGIRRKESDMVLTNVRTGGEYTIHAIDGEGDTRLHLEGLGFVPGTRLKVVSRIGGNLIVGARGSRVALDEHLAGQVRV